MSTDNAGESESTNSQKCQDEGHQAFTCHRNPIYELERPSRSAVETRWQLHNSSSLELGSQASQVRVCPTESVLLVRVKDHAITIDKTEGQ